MIIIKEVILYSTGCPRCKVLEKKLKEKNVKYDEINAVEEMLARGLLETPVLCIDGKMYNFTQAVKLINEL